MSLTERIKEMSLEELASFSQQPDWKSCGIFSPFFRVLFLAKEGYLPNEMEEDVELLLSRKSSKLREKVGAKVRTYSDTFPVISAYLIDHYKITLVNSLQGLKTDYEKIAADPFDHARWGEAICTINQICNSPNFNIFHTDDRINFIKENIKRFPIVGFAPFPFLPYYPSHCICLTSLDEKQLTYFDPFCGKIKTEERNHRHFDHLCSDLLLIDKI